MTNLAKILPPHQPKKYASAGACIYCGASEHLGDEHIVPLGFGGRMVFEKASCQTCASITGAFEGVCLRKNYGPLRMLYDLPSRRKKERPTHLPLKIKHTSDDDWTTVPVAQEKYPFLILFPHLNGPTLLDSPSPNEMGATARTFWIRGAAASETDFQGHLQSLCEDLRVHSCMPVAEFSVPEFCLMVAKIAHSYAVAETRFDAAEWFLPRVILHRELDDRAKYIGCLKSSEKSAALHELDMVYGPGDLLSVRIQLLAVMDTPIYLVHVGRMLN